MANPVKRFKKEEKWLLREYSYLDDLKEDIEKKNQRDSRRIEIMILT